MGGPASSQLSINTLSCAYKRLTTLYRLKAV